MSVSRVSTLGMQQASLSDIKKVQADLFKLQNQISSQYKAQDFAGLNGQVEQYTALNSKIARAQAYLDNNSVVLSRIKQSGVAIDQLTHIADDVKNLILQRRNPAVADGLAFEQQMEALRTTFSNALNTNINGRYLFSGTKTDVQPVQDPFPSSGQPGVPSAEYYQGSIENVVARIDDNFEMEYSVRADEEGFQKIYAAIEQALAGHQGNSDTTLGESLALAQEGIGDIIAIATRNNANQIAVEQVNERHTSLKLYWQGVTEEIAKTDLVAASTQVAVDQSVLQASFQVFARVNSLHLIDFL